MKLMQIKKRDLIESKLIIKLNQIKKSMKIQINNHNLKNNKIKIWNHKLNRMNKK